MLSITLLTLLWLNLFIPGALSEGLFRLNLSPVKGNISEDGYYLQVNQNQDNFSPGNETRACADLDGATFGDEGTLRIDSDEDTVWQLVISSPKNCFMNIGRNTQTVTFNVMFGNQVSGCDDPKWPEMDLEEGPKGWSKREGSYIKLGCNYMDMTIMIDIDNTNVCPKLDSNFNDLVFNVTGIKKGTYEFKPCPSHMVFDNLEGLTFNCSINSDRALEEDECPYCEPGECPCCPLREELEVATPTTSSPPTLRDHKASGVAIAGLTLGAIATAIGLANLAILVYRKSSVNNQDGE